MMPSVWVRVKLNTGCVAFYVGDQSARQDVMVEATYHAVHRAPEDMRCPLFLGPRKRVRKRGPSKSLLRGI